MSFSDPNDYGLMDANKRDSMNMTQISYILLDGIPAHFYSFRLTSFSKHTVMIDDLKGESIESMKKKLNMELWKSEWVQMSHFEGDEGSILEFLHTLFL
ncbi:unnamed protein product [Ambrosiozyma monospora]|uniref:Unnamed protein product n=1 Tax=Ambrosiozyma monospora TaxID=43982 RepID=A0ACB5TSZ2_AMBMO|nr:unnamed protein product [Ambrosiozyma monospora]